jgi:GNAT superfamily N-acetyltransferase
MDGLSLRPARADDAAALTDLALRGKAGWGYDAAFMAACREELTITAARIAAWRFWVAEVAEAPVGMIALNALPDHAELEFFFVDPALQGQGVGQALMAAFDAACRELGLSLIRVDADPNAEAIYQRLGYRTVGRSPSGSIPGRTLPLMERRLA